MCLTRCSPFVRSAQPSRALVCKLVAPLSRLSAAARPTLPHGPSSLPDAGLCKGPGQQKSRPRREFDHRLGREKRCISNDRSPSQENRHETPKDTSHLYRFWSRCGLVRFRPVRERTTAKAHLVGVERPPAMVAPQPKQFRYRRSKLRRISAAGELTSGT